MSRGRYRSWTQLNQYEKCSWQFKLQRIDRIPEVPAIWLPGGTAYHAATEQFDLYACDHGLDEAAEIEWADVFQTEFNTELDEIREIEPDETKWRTSRSRLKAYLETGENEAFWREFGPKWVRKYIDWRLENRRRYDILRLPNGDPVIELELRVLVGGVPVIAKADLAMVDLGTGATIAVDRKSGKNIPEEMDQLGLYGKTMETAGVGMIWYGAFFDARRGKLTKPQPLDRFRGSGSVLDRRFADMDKQVKAGVFEPSITFLCDYCGVNRHCEPFKTYKESQ